MHLHGHKTWVVLHQPTIFFKNIRIYDTIKGVLQFASIAHQGNKGVFVCVCDAYSCRHVRIYGTTIPLDFFVNGVTMFTNEFFGRM